MQGLILRTTHPADESAVCHLFAEPVVLMAGKSQWFVFAAATALFPLTRSLGHTSWCIYHVVADRLQLSSVSRLLQARQEGYHLATQPESETEDSVDHPHSLLHLRDLFITCGCAWHDVQNALRWSVGPLLKGDILQDCHIAVETLRNSSWTLMGFLPQHLAARMRVSDDPELEPDLCRRFWLLPGVDVTMLELMVSLDPWYANGILYINDIDPDEDGPEDPFAKSSQCALYLMKWKTFTVAFSPWVKQHKARLDP